MFPNIVFPHPLDELPRAGNREIRVKEVPLLPFSRNDREENDEKRKD